jgi:hypothetical protein
MIPKSSETARPVNTHGAPIEGPERIMKPGVRWLDPRQLSYLLNPEP